MHHLSVFLACAPGVSHELYGAGENLIDVRGRGNIENIADFVARKMKTRFKEHDVRALRIRVPQILEAQMRHVPDF